MFIKRSFKVFVIVLAVFIMAAVTYAYAASNTVPAGHAGDGSGGITGYVVSAIHYTLNATNPANIDSVAFTLDNAASTVRIVLDGHTYSCSGGPTDWTCDTTSPAATAAGASSLEVVAAE